MSVTFPENYGSAELAGKPVIDTNNYYPQRDGQISELDEGQTTSSELLARHLHQAKVVKAFNQIYYVNLREDGRPAGAPDRTAIPIAGDDEAAKRVVATLIDEIGFDPVDTGPLERGRLFQPDSPLYIPHVTVGTVRDILAKHAA